MEVADRIKAYFDELAEGEWDRLVASPRARVSLHVHREFLRQYVTPGCRVLEVGAGTGRFTIELAELGARVVVTDVSEVQLELNERHVVAADREDAVEDRYLLDVRELGRFGDGTFDLVLIYGGPLSYVFEDAGSAVRESLRVGRMVVGSVMSTLGAWRIYLRQVFELADQIGEAANERILDTGDLRLEGSTSGHTCKMYRARQLTELIEGSGGRVVAMSASNWASLGDEAVLAELEGTPDRWHRFLDQEVAICREPGVLDAGTHILFAACASS